MKKYKVLTNLFRDFNEGDIITLQKNANGLFYHRQELESYSLISGLAVEFVETHSEYFEEIEKTVYLKSAPYCLDEIKVDILRKFQELENNHFSYSISWLSKTKLCIEIK